MSKRNKKSNKGVDGTLIANVITFITAIINLIAAILNVTSK